MSNEFEIKDGVLVKYYGRDKAVTIPDSVTSIGQDAFYGCTSLTSITILNQVFDIESCYDNYYGKYDEDEDDEDKEHGNCEQVRKDLLDLLINNEFSPRYMPDEI